LRGQNVAEAFAEAAASALALPSLVSPPAEAFPLALGSVEPFRPVVSGRCFEARWLSAGFVAVL
jgi:hypothetical protein